MGRGVRSPRAEPANWNWLLAWLALLLCPALALARVGLSVDRAGLFITAGGLSLVTFSVYGADKARAKNGAWRVPEWVLHGLEAAGGWPGAFLGQHIWRHKSAKLSYQVFFWTIVCVHQVVALDYLLGWPMVRAVRNSF